MYFPICISSATQIALLGAYESGAHPIAVAPLKGAKQEGDEVINFTFWRKINKKKVQIRNSRTGSRERRKWGSTESLIMS
jgi:hypothetical protein